MAYIRQDAAFSQRFQQHGSVCPWINTLSDVQNRITSLVRAEITNIAYSSVHSCIYFGEYKAWIECFGSESAVEFPGVFPVGEVKTATLPLVNGNTLISAASTASSDKSLAVLANELQIFPLTLPSTRALAIKLEQSSASASLVNESGIADLMTDLQIRQLRLEDIVDRLRLEFSACTCGRRRSE